jgi:hypothetical protein
VAPAAHTTPIATSWTIDPLRTAGEDYSTARLVAEGSEAAQNSCYERGSGFGEVGTGTVSIEEVLWDLESAWCSSPPGQSSPGP